MTLNKRDAILRTLKVFVKEDLINSKSAIKLIFSLSEEFIYKCIILNLSKKNIYLLCCEEPYFKEYVSKKMFNNYFYTIQRSCKLKKMDLEQKKDFLRRIIKKSSKNNNKCIKNIISTYLDCFIPDIFAFIPYNLNTKQHNDIVFQYLKQLDPIIESFNKSSFYRWFQGIVKNQDSLKEQLLTIPDINTKNSAQAAITLQPDLQINSSSFSAQSIEQNQPSNVLQHPVTVAPNDDPLSTKTLSGATVTGSSIKEETKQQNTPAFWINPTDEVATISSNTEEMKVQDEYNKKRSLYCPKPILPLVPLSPNDPLYPFDKKYDGFFYDQQGLIFDSLSKSEQTEWCPIPKVLELNGSYPNMKSYKYRFVDKFNSIDVISIYSNNLDSFVFEHFGDNSIQKCSFYMIKKEN